MTAQKPRQLPSLRPTPPRSLRLNKTPLRNSLRELQGSAVTEEEEVGEEVEEEEEEESIVCLFVCFYNDSIILVLKKSENGWGEPPSPSSSSSSSSMSRSPVVRLGVLVLELEALTDSSIAAAAHGIGVRAHLGTGLLA